MRKQIGIADISRFGKRLTVYEPPSKVEDQNGTFSKKRRCVKYFVKGWNAEKVEDYYIGAKKHENILETVSIKDIYPRIKHVYDENRVLIARRTALGQPLLLTGKGFSKYSKTK